jgi:hypothetical protein
LFTKSGRKLKNGGIYLDMLGASLDYQRIEASTMENA